MGMYNVLLAALFVSTTMFFGVSLASSERQLLVGYWGQNSAGRISVEKPLKEVCQTTKYNIVAVSFLTNFWDQGNIDDVPALNFANHCGTPISPENPSLLRCTRIEEGIKECQSRGIKVLLSIGGATGDGTLFSPPKAREFARTLFDLFLGGSGKESLRPFGTEIMDGINLDIEGGRYEYYPDLIRELRRLMDGDNTKNYLIAVSPQCPYPDKFMGPEKKGTGLEEAGQYVDHVYVLFYNTNFCSIGSKGFPTTLDKWLGFARSKQRPLIFVGVPAHAMASSNANTYQSPDKLVKIYEKIKTRAGFGGILLWDVSWDQVNIIDGKRYSEYVYNLMKDSSVVEIKPATEASEVPTQEQVAPPLQPPVQEALTCTGKEDGRYPDTSNCAKYHVCSSGTKYEQSCPPGLVFNNAIKACDWPTADTC